MLQSLVEQELRALLTVRKKIDRVIVPPRQLAIQAL